MAKPKKAKKIVEPTPEEAPKFLFQYVLQCNPDGKVHEQIEVHAPNITTHGLARTLLQIANTLFHKADSRYGTEAEKVVEQRRQEVMKDYPAKWLAVDEGKEGLMLCTSCKTAYKADLKGSIVKLPKALAKTAQPCANHMDGAIGQGLRDRTEAEGTNGVKAGGKPSKTL